MSVAPLLEVDGLDLRVGDRGPLVAEDVSFQMAAGEILGVVGESGSGKSMTARAIVDLLPAAVRQAAGDVRFAGRSIAGMTPAELRGLRGARIGMVFQEPMTSLNPALTVGRQLEEGLELHSSHDEQTRRRLILTMLERVGISDGEKALEAHPHQFSGGMRQRIMLASAMLLKPDLLIADEPTTALDAVIQREVMELIVELTREAGTAVLLISHDLPMVARYSQRIVVMREGRVVEAGGTERVLAAPRHDYTRKLLATLPRRLPPRALPQAATLVSAHDLVVDFSARKHLLARPSSKRALKGVSIDIRPKEVVAVVGGSGSGKTTLARALAGLVAPSGGGIRYKGETLAGRSVLRRDYRYNCQMVFQDPYASLDPRMRVSAIVSEALRLHRKLGAQEKSERVMEALGDVGLTSEYASRFPHELSGGQRQRVAIARALVRRPNFVIADEAVSALDVTVRAQVLDLFADLQNRYGFSCLFIAHDLGVVEQIADRVIVMHEGVIVEEGDRDAIFDRPRHDYTRRLLSAIPMLEATGNGGVRLKWRSDDFVPQAPGAETQTLQETVHHVD